MNQSPAAAPARPVTRRWLDVARAFARLHPGAALASAYVLLIVLTGLLAPILPIPNPVAQDLVHRLAPPGSHGHLLGTDALGRDMLSRLILGGRIALLVALLPTAIAAGISLVLGMAAGTYERWVGGVVMRMMDVLFAFPLVLLAVALGTVLGPGTNNLLVVIVVLLVPYMTRTVYVEVILAKESEYVAAARVAGSSEWRLLLDELLPNISGPLIVMATISAGAMIWVGAGLSFLGLGVQPPTAEWGRMTADGAPVLSTAPFVSTFPGVAILSVSFALNVIGDTLRDLLDPVLRRRSFVRQIEFVG